MEIHAWADYPPPLPMGHQAVKIAVQFMTVAGLMGCGRDHGAQPPRRASGTVHSPIHTPPAPSDAGVPAVPLANGPVLTLDGSLAVVIAGPQAPGTDGGASATVDAAPLGTVPRLATPSAAERAHMGPGEEVAQAINPLVEPLRTCFAGTEGASIPPATRSIWMTVDAHGHVTTGGAGGNAPASINTCILEHLQTLQLTPRPGGTHWFGFPLAPPTTATEHGG